MCVLTCSTQTNHRCGPKEVNRLADEFGSFASLLNGTRIEHGDGTTTILQAETSNKWFLWKGGLVEGSPYEEERKHEAELRKLMSADIFDGHALCNELEETTDLSEEDILDKVQKRFGTPARKHVKSCLDKRNAMVDYRKLMAKPGMDHETAVSELEPKYKNKKYKKKGVISWLSHVTSRSVAKAEYDKLEANGVDHKAALSDLELKYTKGVFKWLSHVTSRSAAKAEYEKLMLQDMDPAKALAELKLKYTKGVIDWLSSVTSTSAAKAEYDKLRVDGTDREKVLEMLKLKYTEGVIKWLLSTLSKVDRTNKELGMDLASNLEWTMIVQCPNPNCEAKERTTHIIVDGSKKKIVIPRCHRTIGSKQCFLLMKAMTDTNTPTTSVRAIQDRMVSITVHVLVTIIVTNLTKHCLFLKVEEKEESRI